MRNYNQFMKLNNEFLSHSLVQSMFRKFSDEPLVVVVAAVVVVGDLVVVAFLFANHSMKLTGTVPVTGKLLIVVGFTVVVDDNDDEGLTVVFVVLDNS